MEKSLDKDVLTKWGKLSGVRELIGVYQGERNTSDGGSQTIKIEIWDNGESNPHNRYQIIAMNSAGTIAKSNSEESIIIALQLTHWQDLDV